MCVCVSGGEGYDFKVLPVAGTVYCTAWHQVGSPVHDHLTALCIPKGEKNHCSQVFSLASLKESSGFRIILQPLWT